MKTNQLYLHSTNMKSKPRLKNFQTKSQGKLADGTILRRIEGNVSNDPNYRHGIQILMPNNQQSIVFGSYSDIKKAALDIKKNPDRVFARVRPADGQNLMGSVHYLNQQAPEHQPPSISEVPKDAIRARKLFPNQGSEDQPLDHMQNERRQYKAHLKATNDNTKKFPNSDLADDPGTHPTAPTQQQSSLITEGA